MDFTVICSYPPISFTSCFTEISTFIPEECKKYFFETALKVMTLWTAKSKEWASYTLPLAVVSTAFCLALVYKNRKLIGEKDQSAASVATLTREKGIVEERVKTLTGEKGIGEERIEKLSKENEKLTAFKTSIDSAKKQEKEEITHYLRLLSLDATFEEGRQIFKEQRLYTTVSKLPSPLNTRNLSNKSSTPATTTNMKLGNRKNNTLSLGSSSPLSITVSSEIQPKESTKKKHTPSLQQLDKSQLPNTRVIISGSLITLTGASLLSAHKPDSERQDSGSE